MASNIIDAKMMAKMFLAGAKNLESKKGRLDAEKYVESLGFKLTDVPASISKESKITAPLKNVLHYALPSLLKSFS